MSRYNKILKKSMSLNFIYKFFGIAIGYLTLPYVLNKLGSDQYGIWIAIYSTITWIIFFDMGLGNGLKNKLTNSIVKNRYDHAKSYIINGYLVSGIISFIIFVTTISFVNLINLVEFFNIKTISDQFVKQVVIFNIFFVCLNFISRLNEQFYYSTHKSEIVGLKVIVTQVLSFLGILLLVKYDQLDLFSLTLNYGLIQTVVEVFFTIYFFRNNPNLIPNKRVVKATKPGELMSLGLKFFLIQISMLIIFNTDNFLILKYLDANSVTIYSLIAKLFSFFIMVSNIILTPYWVLFGEAYIKKDFKWIKKVLMKFSYLSLIILATALIMAYSSELILNLWIGKKLNIDLTFTILFAILIFLRIFNNVYMYFLNGTGFIKLQMYLYIFGAIINIPITILLLKLGMGLSGIVLGGIISILPMTILLTVQVYLIIKEGIESKNIYIEDVS